MDVLNVLGVAIDAQATLSAAQITVAKCRSGFCTSLQACYRARTFMSRGGLNSPKTSQLQVFYTEQGVGAPPSTCTMLQRRIARFVLGLRRGDIQTYASFGREVRTKTKALWERFELVPIWSTVLRRHFSSAGHLGRQSLQAYVLGTYLGWRGGTWWIAIRGCSATHLARGKRGGRPPWSPSWAKICASRRRVQIYGATRVHHFQSRFKH